MNVLILSSASENIDKYYLSITRSIAGYLAKQECNLVYGASSTSMMGVCYDEFKKHNREIYAFTTEKYQDDLKNLDGCHKFVEKDTFDMKREMFESSDLIVVLAGGLGTLSEYTTYLEENRSNDKCVPIIVYDEDKFYKYLIMHFKHASEKQFISEDVFNNFKYTTNKDEFEDAYWNAVYNINKEKTRGGK